LIRSDDGAPCSLTRLCSPANRFIVKASPTALNTFEQILFGPISIILQQDIDREWLLSGRMWSLIVSSRIYPVRLPNIGADARTTQRWSSSGIP
jgi:hypothetical protein